MSNSPKSARPQRLIAHILEEEYCCMAGYLQLCRARGERVVEMAENFQLSPLTIWSHYRKLADGKHKCEKAGNCLASIIAEIECSPKPRKGDVYE